MRPERLFKSLEQGSVLDMGIDYKIKSLFVCFQTHVSQRGSQILELSYRLGIRMKHAFLNKIVLLRCVQAENVLYLADSHGGISIYNYRRRKLFKYVDYFRKQYLEIQSLERYQPHQILVGTGPSLVLFDLIRSQQLKVYYGHLSGINKIISVPQEKLILTASYDCQIKLWKEDCNYDQLRMQNPDAIRDFVIFKKLKLLVAACFDHSLLLWDTESFKLQSQIREAHQDAIVCLLKLRRYLVSGSFDNNIKIWRFDDKNQLTFHRLLQ